MEHTVAASPLELSSAVFFVFLWLLLFSLSANFLAMVNACVQEGTKNHTHGRIVFAAVRFLCSTNFPGPWSSVVVVFLNTIFLLMCV